MIGRFFEDILLTLNPVDVFIVVDNGFFDHFHCVQTWRLMIMLWIMSRMSRTVLGKKDFGIGTATNHFEQLEVLQTNRRRTRWEILYLTSNVNVVPIGIIRGRLAKIRQT